MGTVGTMLTLTAPVVQINSRGFEADLQIHLFIAQCPCVLTTDPDRALSPQPSLQSGGGRGNACSDLHTSGCLISIYSLSEPSMYNVCQNFLGHNA